MTLLGDLERMTTIKTLIFNLDLNFLSIDDLKEISYIAYDLGITNFPEYDLDNIYNSEYDKIVEIYKIYCDFAYNEVIKIQNEIENKMRC